MILTGLEIIAQVEAKRVRIEPFSAENATTNTYDLRLGDELIRYLDDVIDPAREPRVARHRLGPEGLVMARGDFLLGHSVERVGSDHFVPIIHARSSIARLGLFVHVTADLIDIGSFGQITFQLYATLPIRLRPGMRIGQVSFWVPQGEVSLYNGKYQGSEGPRPSEAYRDFTTERQSSGIDRAGDQPMSSTERASISGHEPTEIDPGGSSLARTRW